MPIEPERKSAGWQRVLVYILELFTSVNMPRRMESRGATEKAKKVRQCYSEVFRYLIVAGHVEYNSVEDLTSAMSGHKLKY